MSTGMSVPNRTRSAPTREIRVGSDPRNQILRCARVVIYHVEPDLIDASPRVGRCRTQFWTSAYGVLEPPGLVGKLATAVYEQYL